MTHVVKCFTIMDIETVDVCWKKTAYDLERVKGFYGCVILPPRVLLFLHYVEVTPGEQSPQVI